MTGCAQCELESVGIMTSRFQLPYFATFCNIKLPARDKRAHTSQSNLKVPDGRTDGRVSQVTAAERCLPTKFKCNGHRQRRGEHPGSGPGFDRTRRSIDTKTYSRSIGTGYPAAGEGVLNSPLHQRAALCMRGQSIDLAHRSSTVLFLLKKLINVIQA